jgi:hypothetical protein
MARGLGIEIDSDGVRALALEGGKRPRILAFSERHIDPDESRPWSDRAREALLAAVAETGVRGRVVASIDSGDAILRELQLPFTNDEQIRKTVRFELEQHVHNHAIEDLVVDYVKTGSTEKGSQILVAAVPKTLIEERIRLLDSAGADPALLDLDALALFNALVEAGAVKDDAPLLAIHGGARFTKFLLIENRRPKAIRTLRYSPTPPAPVAEEATAETGSGEPAAGDEPYVLVDNSTPVDILAIEAGRFLMASAASAVPSRIIITGRLDSAAVSAALTEATGAPVEPFDLLEKFAPVPPSVQGLDRRVPVALGLALKAVERDASGTDFRREEFSYGRKFENVKSSALVLVDLVLMLLALVALHLHFKAVDLKAETDLLYSYHAQVVADAVEHDPTKIPPPLKEDPSQSLRFMQGKLKQISEEVGAGDHPIERSSLNLLSRIWRTMEQFHHQHKGRKTGEQEYFFLVESVNATQVPDRGTAQITMSGQASTVLLAEAFLQMVKLTAPFSSGWTVESTGYRAAGPNQGFTFTFRKGKE